MSDDDESDLASEIETITLTYRDTNDNVVCEIEFDLTCDDGLRFQWWMVSQGLGNA